MLKPFLYRSYCWFYLLSQWRGTRLTRPGVVVLTAICLAGLTGINIFQTAIHQILILCLAYLGAAVGFSFFSRTRVRILRLLPEYATTGKNLTYTMELVNDGKKTEKDLVLIEDLADPRPSLPTLLTHKEPFEDNRNAWDRKTLYYRWLWLIRKNEKARFKPLPLPDLPPATRIRVKITIRPHTRGYLNFKGVILARPDPLGLFNHLTRISLPHKLPVLPSSFDVDLPRLDSPRKHHAGGISLASSVGNADEFISLRDYLPGDSLRHIHWKTYARTQTLVVKEFEDEHYVRHALVLDTHAPGDHDYGEAVFEEAVSIAASIIRSMNLSESILDLVFVGNQVYSLPWGRGMADSGKLLEVLACVQPCQDRDISDLTAHLRENFNLLSGSILILLDWDTEREKLTAQMQAAGIQTKPILVCNGKEGAKKRLEEKIRMSELRLPHVTIVTAGRAEKELGS